MNATNRKFLRVLCLCLCLLCCLPLLAGCGSCGGSDEPARYTCLSCPPAAVATPTCAG